MPLPASLSASIADTLYLAGCERTCFAGRLKQTYLNDNPQKYLQSTSDSLHNLSRTSLLPHNQLIPKQALFTIYTHPFFLCTWWGSFVSVIKYRILPFLFFPFSSRVSRLVYPRRLILIHQRMAYGRATWNSVHPLIFCCTARSSHVSWTSRCVYSRVARSRNMIVWARTRFVFIYT